MSLLADIYIKKETLEVLLKTIEKKGGKAISITVSVEDEAGNYDQNLSAYVSQSKEDREAKKNKFYVGNGKVFWNNGKVVNGKDAPKKAIASGGKAKADDDDDLPF